MLSSDFDSLISEISSRANKLRQPINGTFELTERCNLSCQMCYVRQPAEINRSDKNEIPASLWLAIADQAIQNGMVFLLLTGGEVFLRTDFFDIYKPLTRKGLFISLFTNGTLINDSIAAKLAESPPNRTEITLYGASSKTYESITKVNGSYKKSCAGIENLLKYKIPLSLKTTLTQQNIRELSEMKQMALNWGVPFTISWLLTNRRDGAQSEVKDCRLNVSEVIALENKTSSKVITFIEPNLPENAINTNVENFFCQAGKSSFVINSQGEMNACIDLPFPRISLLKCDFNTAWKNVQEFVESNSILSETCLRCEAREYCYRCPARSFSFTGTFNEPIPYLCKIAYEKKTHYEKKL